MEEQEFSELFSLIESFNNLYEMELSNAPYDLNLLDIWHPNENAHTKILVQLLKYRVNERYPFLESLLERWFRDINLELLWTFSIVSFPTFLPLLAYLSCPHCVMCNSFLCCPLP
jgi:hypothetical protein